MVKQVGESEGCMRGVSFPNGQSVKRGIYVNIEKEKVQKKKSGGLDYY